MTTRKAGLDALIAGLRDHFGERLSQGAAVREQHGQGFSYFPTSPPDAVVFVQSKDEVVRVVTACAAAGVPVIPYGTGTSVEGQIAALEGGICIDVSGMNRVLAVHAEDFDVVVEPGVTRRALNAHLRDQGLFFPIDPGADASIGGMTSTRASGTNAVRYGTMRESVLALEVVTPAGTLIRTGSRAKKSSTGYDLTRLFVGAEGTLGVITEVTLRLHPIPEAISAAVCSFASLKGTVDTAIATIQMGIPVARIELLDETAVRAANVHSKLDLPVAPTLFLEFHGTPAWVEEQAQVVQEIAADNGGSGFEWATRQEDRERLWRARHDQAFAARTLWPGTVGWTTDVCVPISQITDSILATRADVDASHLEAKIIGHIGDGNFHATYAIKPGDAADLAEAERLAGRVVERALACGGTASGEHGVGYGKLRYMRKEHGAGIELMRALKQALDPQGIMNPGKILPAA
jgi:D-lactate dehydrogenase (cytochrome)